MQVMKTKIEQRGKRIGSSKNLSTEKQLLKQTYHYNTYRIAAQSESALLESNNPFALAVFAGYYLIKSKSD
jgi:hypothetical protein